MSDRVIVLAGSYRQARQWAWDEGLSPNEWLYPVAADTLRGVRASRLELVGTWYERPDAHELEMLARTAVSMWRLP